MKRSDKYIPPYWADKFLQWYCDAHFIEEIQGDLYEAFHRRCKERAASYAAGAIVCAARRTECGKVQWKTLESEPAAKW